MQEPMRPAEKTALKSLNKALGGGGMLAAGKLGLVAIAAVGTASVGTPVIFAGVIGAVLQEQQHILPLLAEPQLPLLAEEPQLIQNVLCMFIIEQSEIDLR